MKKSYETYSTFSLTTYFAQTLILSKKHVLNLVPHFKRVNGLVV